MFFRSNAEAKRIQAQLRARLARSGHLGTADDRLYRTYIKPEQDLFQVGGNFLALSNLASTPGSITPLLDASGTSSIFQRLRQLAPELAVDLEWKIGTLIEIGEQTVAFMEAVQTQQPKIDAAQASGDENTLAEIGKILIDKASTAVGFAQSVFSDQRSSFGRQTYDRSQHLLGALGVDRRRALHAFYAQMDVTEAVYQRVLEREVPAALARKVIEVRDLIRWVIELHNATMAAVDRGMDVLLS